MTSVPNTNYANPNVATLASVVSSIHALLGSKERLRLLLLMAVVITAALANASVPVLLAGLLERIQQVQGFATASLWSLASLMLAFIATRAATRVLGALDAALFSPVGETLVWRVSKRLAEAAAAGRVSSKTRDDLGELGALQERISKASRAVFSVIYVVVLRLLPIVVEVLFVGVVLGRVMGWHAPIIIAAAGGLYWFFVSLGRGREAQVQRELQASYTQVARRTAELTGNARLVEEYAAHEFMDRRIQSAVDVALSHIRRIVKVQLLRAIGAAAGISICYGVAMIYAWFFMRNGELGVGATFLLISYVDRIIGPLNNVSNYITILRNALIHMELCEELGIFARPGKTTDGPSPPAKTRGNVEDGLSIEGEHRFKLMPGEAVSVVGPSGAGKSSFLSRVYERGGTEGAVGREALSMNELVSCFPAGEVCYLASQVTLLPGSVQNNILLGNEELQYELATVWRGVWPPVDGKPFATQLDTDIGDLSAGERQRVGLARALLRRPRMLILDEATNALDLASEKAVWAFVRTWLPNSILLVAAHRIENFKDAEHEIRIGEGRVESVR